MTHYYLYIAAGAELDATAKFFKVAVGSSKQSQRDYLFLLAHSVEHFHFFEMWSNEVDLFLDKCWTLSGLDRALIQQVSARELVRAFKSNAYPALSQQYLHNVSQMRFALNTAYRVQSNLNRMRTSSAKRSTY